MQKAQHLAFRNALRHREEFGGDQIFAIRPACQIDKDRGEAVSLDMAPDPGQSAVTDHLNDLDEAAIQLPCGSRDIRPVMHRHIDGLGTAQEIIEQTVAEFFAITARLGALASARAFA